MTDPVTNLNNHLSVSETVTGLILLGKQSPTVFNADKFSGKYKNIVQDIKLGKTEEDLIIKYGTNLIQPAKYSAKSVNGLGSELDWVDVLDKVYRNELLDEEAGKFQKQLRNGESEKASETLRRMSTTMVSTQRMRSISADEITDEYVPFMKSGSPVWDKHIGGFPTMGVIVLGAKTFTGKTTVAISLMEDFMKEYPDRDIMFVTLEDLAEGWKERAKVILGEREKKFWQRVKIMEFAKSADEIIEEAARYEDLGLIVIDYIDYLAKGKDLDSYEQIYRGISQGSKSLAATNKFRSMPILALAQFGKGAYSGGVPTPSALLYTGEDKAYQICMLYHAENDFYSDNPNSPYELPMDKGRGYLVFWKVKNGCRPHIQEFPGAIQTLWTSKYGFDMNYEDSKWLSLASETKKKTRSK